MEILGAGISGCLACIVNPKSIVYEAGDGSSIHKAVLRFRSDKISELTGIPFKKVNVIKSIWSDGKEVASSPRIVSLYSKKVSDTYTNRSIVNIENSIRWIAPDDFHEILKDLIGHNIKYNTTVDANLLSHMARPIISTIPIMILAKILGLNIDVGKNIVSSIYIEQYEVDKCDMYSTVYYPDSNTGVYRATITGDVLIIESIGEYGVATEEMLNVLESLGIDKNSIKKIGNYKQEYGKIVAINEQIRREFIVNATINYGVYSLGRFAIWKNIVLDDVLNDIYRIREFINKGHYEYLKKESEI